MDRSGSGERMSGRFVTLPCVDGSEREVAVLDVDEVVALEHRIAAEGTSLLELMKRAGRALADYALASVPAKAKVVVLAGSGNNGGDGWVAARILADAGHEVVVVTREAPDALQAEPARTAALEEIGSSRDEFAVGSDASDSDDHRRMDPSCDSFAIMVNPGEQELDELLCSADLVIDAILGTGFAHEQVRDPYATWIDLANSAHQDGGLIVISADCPSGLNAQTGKNAAQCVVADATVTMLAPKRGLLEPNASRFIGALLLAPLVQAFLPT